MPLFKTTSTDHDHSVAKRAKPKDQNPDAVSRAERLKKVKKALGWSWEKWSTKSGYSRSYLSNLVQGHMEAPTIDVLLRVADSAGASLQFLATGKGPMWARELQPEALDPYPSRAPFVAAARLLPYGFAESVAAELLAQQANDDGDPGAAHWSALLTALLTKHAKTVDHSP